MKKKRKPKKKKKKRTLLVIWCMFDSRRHVCDVGCPAHFVIYNIFFGVLIIMWLASLRSFELKKMMLEQLQKGAAIGTKKKISIQNSRKRQRESGLFIKN